MIPSATTRPDFLVAVTDLDFFSDVTAIDPISAYPPTKRQKESQGKSPPTSCPDKSWIPDGYSHTMTNAGPSQIRNPGIPIT